MDLGCMQPQAAGGKAATRNPPTLAATRGRYVRKREIQHHHDDDDGADDRDYHGDNGDDSNDDYHEQVPSLSKSPIEFPHCDRLH